MKIQVGCDEHHWLLAVIQRTHDRPINRINGKYQSEKEHGDLNKLKLTLFKAEILRLLKFMQKSCLHTTHQHLLNKIDLCFRL